MTTDIRAMREKTCELGLLLHDRELSDAARSVLERIDSAACILHKSGALSSFAPVFAARPALLKEEISKYGDSDE